MTKAEALARVEELEAELDTLTDVSAIEQSAAHIVMTWIDYPGGRVGLDAAGNMVRVEFDPATDRWVAE